MTLLELIRATPTDGPNVESAVLGQLLQLKEALTKNGKPYLDVEIGDATGSERLKIWEDSRAYDFLIEREPGDAVRFSGLFRRNQYGLNVDHLEVRLLSSSEKQELLAGNSERQAQQQIDWQTVSSAMEGLTDPRLRGLACAFLKQYEERFKRAAAAREFHHARRGGLLEHTAQMLRSAIALEKVYPQLNWELVKAGVLFHDCGKLWENDYEPEGFVSPLSMVGELLGHVSIGIEVVNRLWRTLESDPSWSAAGEPPADQVRQHLLHLIASHHGQREYGAPVTPRTPEGWALHYIDNLDARIEMLLQTYAAGSQAAPGIYDYRRPLEGRPIHPLAKWISKS